MSRCSMPYCCLVILAILAPLNFVRAQAAPASPPNEGKDYSHSSVVSRMMVFDTQHTGKLTRAQITDWRFLRLFDRADVNHDGVVTIKELEELAATLDVSGPGNGPREFAGPDGPNRFEGPPPDGGFGGPPPGGFDGPPPGGFGGPGPEHREVDWKQKISQLDLSKLPPASNARDLTYERDIQPILKASCTQCHGSQRTRGGLRLDSLDAIRQGSDNGPVIVAGNSKESHLIIAASRIDADTAMPPQRGGRFNPAGMIAGQIMRQAAPAGKSTITKDQFIALGKTWFEKADAGKTGTVTETQFASAVAETLRPQGFGGPRPPGEQGGNGPDGPPPSGGPPGGGPGRAGGSGPPGPGRFDPMSSTARALFEAASDQKSDSLTSEQLESGFGHLFDRWDSDKSGSLTEEKVRTGLSAMTPPPPFGEGRQPPPGGGPGGFRGPGGPPGGPGGGPQAKPLTAEQVGMLRAWIDQGAK